MAKAIKVDEKLTYITELTKVAEDLKVQNGKSVQFCRCLDIPLCKEFKPWKAEKT